MAAKKIPDTLVYRLPDTRRVTSISIDRAILDTCRRNEIDITDSVNETLRWLLTAAGLEIIETDPADAPRKHPRARRPKRILSPKIPQVYLKNRGRPE